MQTGDAAGKMIGGVEERSICIRDFETLAKKFRRNTRLSLCRRVAPVEEFHGFASPDGPMTEKAADDAAFDGAAV